MNSRSKYKTKQREMLLSYLETIPGEHITAVDVFEYLRQQGASIGKATVYRQLESFVSEGILKKYIFDANTPACYEYVGMERFEETEPCFHCKCEKCGKLIHLHCDELAEIQSHLYVAHQFKLDPMRTVFYGLCEHCN